MNSDSTRAAYAHDGLLPQRARLLAGSRAKLDDKLYCLRHTYGSYLVQASVPLRVVQTLMGHSDFSTTEKYAHVGQVALDESARLISL